MDEYPIIFREVQFMRKLWVVWPITIFVLLVALGSFGQGMYRQLIQGEPWGDKPMSDTELLMTGVLFILICLMAVWLVYVARLITEVHADGLYVRYVPFHRRFQRFTPTDIQAYAVRTYRPLRDYGGWGIRWSRRGKAYNVSGNRGVELELADGKRLLIGSQQPEALASALAVLLKRPPTSVA
jgi:hypothetical protein